MEKELEAMQGDDVGLLEYPDNLRTRPGMYIGDTKTPDVILREIFDNSVDELYKIGTRTNTIKISVDPETGTTIIGDNGRGIPNKIDEKTGKYQLELAMAYLHAGSKFKDGKDASIGMNGVGAAATNALSKSFEVWSSGKYMKWEYGRKVSESDDQPKPEGFEDLMTVTKFTPDETMFDDPIPHIPYDNLRYVRFIAKLKGKPVIHLIVNGVEDDSEVTPPKFKIDIEGIGTVNGIEHPYRNVFFFNWELGSLDLRYDGTVNGLHTPEGIHTLWFRNSLNLALSKILNVPESKMFELGQRILSVVIASEAIFDSQTKVRLVGIKGYNGPEVYNQIEAQARKIVNDNKEFFGKLVTSISIYRDSAKKAQEARQIAGMLKGTLNLSGNKQDRVKSAVSATIVKDCSTKDRSKAEMFIVEGKSAAGTLLQGRDPNIHSILPLRGRPLSAFRVDWSEMLQNREWLNFVLAVGGGIDKLKDTSKVRYGKIIIAADADPDGMNIAISFLGSLATHMRYLFDMQIVYILETPLYQDTKTNKYYYLGEESQVNFASGNIRRFKGLGEFTPKQFKEIAFNPEGRRLAQVTLEDVDKALDMIRNTGPKKELMMSNGFLGTGIAESDLPNIKLRLM